jgi:uncharacterized coiled-coil protein SlyX
LNAQAQTLTANLADKERKLKVLEDKNAALFQTNNVLTDNVASSNSTIAELSVNVTKKEAEIELLNKQIMQMSSKISSFLNAVPSLHRLLSCPSC